MEKVKQGIIIYSSHEPDSYMRAVDLKKTYPKDELWLVANEKDSPKLFTQYTFSEIVLLPEVKNKKKELFAYVTTPAKINLLSEKAFDTKKNSLPEEVKETTPLENNFDSSQEDLGLSYKTRRKPKKKKNKNIGLYLLFFCVFLLFIGFIFLFR